MAPERKNCCCRCCSNHATDVGNEERSNGFYIFVTKKRLIIVSSQRQGYGCRRPRCFNCTVGSSVITGCKWWEDVNDCNFTGVVGWWALFDPCFTVPSKYSPAKRAGCQYCKAPPPSCILTNVPYSTFRPFATCPKGRN